MADARHKQKLYCYLDETGQDTQGRLFLVAVVIAGEDRDDLAAELERIEAASGKRLSKWRKASFERKTGYIRSVLALPQIGGCLFYARYAETKAYLDLMVYAAARAILLKGREPYKATIIVDGLSGADVRKFGHGLRALRVSVRKVRGIDDERDALVRLADALAGFVRDYLERQPYAITIFREVGGERLLRELR
jgi:hypothetical protein